MKPDYYRTRAEKLEEINEDDEIPKSTKQEFQSRICVRDVVDSKFIEFEIPKSTKQGFQSRICVRDDDSKLLIKISYFDPSLIVIQDGSTCLEPFAGAIFRSNFP